MGGCKSCKIYSRPWYIHEVLSGFTDLSVDSRDFSVAFTTRDHQKSAEAPRTSDSGYQTSKGDRRTSASVSHKSRLRPPEIQRRSSDIGRRLEKSSGDRRTSGQRSSDIEKRSSDIKTEIPRHREEIPRHQEKIPRHPEEILRHPKETCACPAVSSDVQQSSGCPKLLRKLMSRFSRWMYEEAQLDARRFTCGCLKGTRASSHVHRVSPQCTEALSACTTELNVQKVSPVTDSQRYTIACANVHRYPGCPSRLEFHRSLRVSGLAHLSQSRVSLISPSL